MAVNISMRDLIDPAFPDEIDELIREAGAPETTPGEAVNQALGTIEKP